MNEPIMLSPSGKNYLWGGHRLNDEFEKHIELSPLAETWECSTHSDGPSYVHGGEYDGLTLKEVIQTNPMYLGKKYMELEDLPILVKFIDARESLSIQVHPDDNYAYTHEGGQLGKTEMWYVLDAKNDTKLIYGFNHEVDSGLVEDAIKAGNLLNHLQQVKVKKHDVFFIEPGTVHAIGAGALIAEIQENSNLTYRLYDYNRVGIDGKKRALHIEKALNVTNFNSSVEPKQPIRVLKYNCGMASELLCRCKYFEVNRMIINTERHQVVCYSADSNSFRVLLCLSGCGTISTENSSFNFYKGECIFVPADSEIMRIHGQAQFLDIRG